MGDAFTGSPSKIPIFYFNKQYEAIAAIQLLGKKIQNMRGNVLKIR